MSRPHRRSRFLPASACDHCYWHPRSFPPKQSRIHIAALRGLMLTDLSHFCWFQLELARSFGHTVCAMPLRARHGRTFLSLLLSFAGIAPLAPVPVWVLQNYQPLLSFGVSNQSASFPASRLILGSGGMLYGTTNGMGTVFRVNTNGSNYYGKCTSRCSGDSNETADEKYLIAQSACPFSYRGPENGSRRMSAEK